MKRVIKFVLVLMLTLGVVGCGNKTGAQEDRVHELFTVIKEGSIRKVKKLLDSATDDAGIVEYMNSIDNFYDHEYGKKWNKEFKSFRKAVFEKVVAEYEIKDVEVDEEETKITVKGKYIDLGAYDSNEADIMGSKALADYIDELKEVFKDLTTDGISETLEKSYELKDKYAKAYFKEALKAIEKLDTNRFTFTITLTEDSDEWIIGEIETKTLWNGIEEASYDDDDDDYDFDFDSDDDSNDYDYNFNTYKVDPDKVKPENTILGKGNLVGGYENNKYIDTPFEFLDYNITTGDGKELEKFGYIDTTSGVLKFELEIAGNVGDSFVLVIEDDRNRLVEEEMSLTEAQMVITKELTGIDVGAKIFKVRLIPASEYNFEYHYGSSFGSLTVYKR